MTILKNTIILILISLFFVLCNKEQNEVIVPIAHTVDKAEKILLDVSNELGYNCFSNLSKKQADDKNLIVSPINSALAFNTLIYASDNETNKQLKQYLRINHLSDSEINVGFDNLNKLFTEIDINTELEGINVITVSPELELNKDFEDFITKRQYAKISKDENAGFVDEINSKKQHNSARSFQMINSLNFSSSIKYQKGVEEIPFYITPDETSFVKMIVAESEFNYYSDPSIQAVELPLGRGNYNLLMVVPQGSQTLKDLSIKMNDRLLKRIKSKFKPRTLEVYLPLLNLSGIETFRSTLSKGKMNNCFNKRADFSKLSPTKNIYISDFEQINNFKLTTANNQYQPTDITEKSTFLIDHPFLFVVYEKYSEAIILIGKISNF